MFPNAGVESWYKAVLDGNINTATLDLLREVSAAWSKTPPLFPGSHITAAYGDAAIAPRVHAAGVVFRVGDAVLLLHRVDGHGWAFPGGSVDYGETGEQAARREAYEETGYTLNEPLVFVRSQAWADVDFDTFALELPAQFVPVLNGEHDSFRWVTLEQAARLRLHPGVRDTLLGGDADVAMDAPSPTKALQAALAKWGADMIKRFDKMAQRVADSFAARNQQATQIGMLAQLKKAGFSVAFKPTQKSMEAYRIVAAENVGLIRSIPRKYHADVEQKVWNAVREGSDLHTLSVELRKAHGITVKRAALIARDQNAKAKAVIERTRRQELGIHRAIWMHSHAGKEPRPTHVEMDGKPYDLAKGMWDSDEGKWVHPGQLINCRCTSRPIIDGFED